MTSAFIYSDEMCRYDMGADHPLKPQRLRLTKDLASAYGLLESRLVTPRPASRQDLLEVHDSDYVGIVERLSRGEKVDAAWNHGFDYGDNRPFPGMYDAALLYTGASITAAEMIMSGEAERPFNISGGLHHAKPGRASGFCVFNDPAIAIKRLLRKYDRVAYIDIDAHHGDGVQAIFYNTSRVLTISIHESGDYLFPGTGYPTEIGEDEGTGFSVNIPLLPYSGDEVILWAFEEIVPPLIDRYDPRVIVAQLGADAHFQDPLAHLQLTSKGFEHLVKRMLSFGKPILALGGGGYNVQTVARLWTIAFALMCDVALSDEVPRDFASRYHVYHLHDPHQPTIEPRRAVSIKNTAEQTIQTLKQLVFPIHGLTEGH